MKLNLLTQDMIDDYDPALMFTIPRLAIIWFVIFTIITARVAKRAKVMFSQVFVILSLKRGGEV